eukprot:TRINITY_DN15242_c0_g2_i2.p1 TRINITY_DN15242_c0_g2~~TRINITY_DN15242_c0_g2_i2.p1  ORF type:complete len:992 (+),score=137.20 TRINITY_DN15242_c0_g2_i2:417-2978(+)
MLRSLSTQTHKELKSSVSDADFRARFTGIPIEDVQAYVNAEICEMRACLQLPLAVLLFVSFVLSVYFHEQSHIIHGQKQALVFDLEENAAFAFAEETPFEHGRMGHKNLYDVNTFADFWSWLNLGFVPRFWEDGWALSESRTVLQGKCRSTNQNLQDAGIWDTSGLTDIGAEFQGSSCPEAQDLKPGSSIANTIQEWSGKPRTPTHMWFNAVVGGVRMQQERAKVIACPEAATYSKNLYSGTCIEPTEFWLRPQRSEAWAKDNSRIDQPGGETVYLLSGRSPAEIRKELRDLEDAAWMSPFTSRVSLLFTSYNPHLDILNLGHITIYINSAGHFFRELDPLCIWLHPYQGWWCYVVDITWMLCILQILAELGVELIHACRSKTKALDLAEFFRLSNLADLFHVAFAATIAAQWIAHLQELQELDDLLSSAQAGVPGSWVDPTARARFFDLADEIAIKSRTRIDMLSFYPFALVSRFFEVCAGQPRLSLVTKTLIRAATDVFHFSIVFGFVFAVFAAAAMIRFGSFLPDFATYTRSLDTSFHVLVGDWDWESMSGVGLVEAGLWFWAFIWLIELCMFNMLLAIMMDVYTDTRGSLEADSETLWSQAIEVYTRWRKTRQGLRVSLLHVKRHVDEKGGDKQRQSLLARSSSSVKNDETPSTSEGSTVLVNVKTLMKIVPGLEEEQSIRILKAAHDHNLTRLRAQESQTMAEAMLGISTMHRKLSGMLTSIENLFRLQDLHSGMVLKAIRHQNELIEAGFANRLHGQDGDHGDGSGNHSFERTMNGDSHVREGDLGEDTLKSKPQLSDDDRSQYSSNIRSHLRKGDLGAGGRSSKSQLQDGDRGEGGASSNMRVSHV